ncbi:hypothetical protein NIZ92_06660 [Alcaligenes sp. 1735tsa3]|uniref:DUF2971 domain-containing protein n=1 Tax=Alcaligenes sp. 1735tsa3 TaxID=2953809 RepID=UPI0020A7A9C3|nr:hypothetical protein [Alcaligenes sp. 1735tsa3]USY26713.1 hypothetical protein NIZ92_06660 [Alcaligenes sp. 1735tsa3]
MEIAHQIVDDETPIARYISFEKFFHMMAFQEAFWPSLHKLRDASGNQGDPLEGSGSFSDLLSNNGFAAYFDIAMAAWPGGRKEKIEGRLERMREIENETFETPFGLKKRTDYIDVLDHMSTWVDVWCWNKYDHERVDMWRAYGGGPGSVMITSTVGKVKNALSTPRELALAITEVEYVEEIKGSKNINRIFSPLSKKSHVYKSEQELRFLLYDKNSPINSPREARGTKVKLNLHLMITDVVAHYQTSSWMMESINKITNLTLGRDAKKSYIQMEIEHSSIARAMFNKQPS